MDLNDFSKLPKNKKADIALVLEGTYPFIRGGVSSWVHQIICGLPEIEFALIFIGDKKENYPELKYDLPDNVVHLSCFYIMEQTKVPDPKPRKGNKQAFSQIRAMHDNFQYTHDINFDHLIGKVIENLTNHKLVNYKDFLYSEEAWSFITERYHANANDTAFLSYFWTIRAMHVPIFALLNALNKIPDAHVYHTISTGYAGLFSVMLRHTKNTPVILTEHGIYTKERKIELSQVDWINDAHEGAGSGLDVDFGYLRRLWIRFFESIGRITYSTADSVYAITEGNRRKQIADGADPEKVSVVSNGVDLDQFKTVRESRPNKPPLIVGFIGRVVSIKDVKTFIRAIRTVSDEFPEMQAWIIGGEDEDPTYASECRDLVNSLDLEETIIYKGFCNVADVMKDIGVVVLSSISEGLPLVILEAFASSRPVVSTDVGACRELIEGGTDEDKKLGIAGAVVNIADSEALAQQISRFFSDSEYWQKACVSAEKRVEKYFNQDVLFQKYRKIYNAVLDH
ncbi:MAG: GT4 family glycosyltransferase PelF [Methylococcales bacterium]|nr:GT4 family glycosyltransferase PelF [Methylococcales bacterium]